MSIDFILSENDIHEGKHIIPAGLLCLVYGVVGVYLWSYLLCSDEWQ